MYGCTELKPLNLKVSPVQSFFALIRIEKASYCRAVSSTKAAMHKESASTLLSYRLRRQFFPDGLLAEDYSSAMMPLFRAAVAASVRSLTFNLSSRWLT